MVDGGHWHVNTGEKTVHAKRMLGQYRSLKNITGAVWLLFFLGPYLRWDGHQAVLLDIPNRRFHIFGITVLPQDVWMLSLVLLFFAILLAVVTSIAGRVFCGYFCFQTVWTDIYTWIEDRLEGPPQKRHALDQSRWTASVWRIKIFKHILWLLIAALTGISFASWFTDVFSLWHDYLTFQASSVAWTVLGLFTAGTYLFAGFMREQVCFWLCPYARIQGVMYDRETILPTYDHCRGEPRGARKKNIDSSTQGDCIDCHLCVSVCPTGIDIREGQQEGCITCALCIDACDFVMKKIHKPLGLVRYASLAEIEGETTLPLFKRARVLVYLTIMTLAFSEILYGITHLSSIELTVLHERQPLYVLLSNGNVQNKYDLKILNKTGQPVNLFIQIVGLRNWSSEDLKDPVLVPPYQIITKTIFLQVPFFENGSSSLPVIVQLLENQKIISQYETMLIGPSP